MSNSKALLILNGKLDLNKSEIETIIKERNINKVIAVDGGSNNIKNLNIIPDLIIGDLDSVTDNTLNYYRNHNVEIREFPVEKDQTDSEIAVEFCQKKNYHEIFITAALGGRIDQQIANLNLLEYINELGLKAKIISRNVEIALIDKFKDFKGKEGYRLSLIPQTKVVEKLSIQGCKYNLDGRNIYRSKSRGVSNLIKNSLAKVSIKSGLLIYVLEKLE